MAIKEDWKDIGNILGNDYVNHRIHIRYRTHTIRCAFLSNITFSDSNPIAKPISKSNPIQTIVAAD
jgi:hypothetical protein